MAGNNYSYLLVGLIGLAVAEPFGRGSPHLQSLLQAAFTGVLVIGAFSLTESVRVHRAGLGLAAVGLVSAVVYWLAPSLAVQSVNLLAVFSFCVLAIVVSAADVASPRGAVTVNRLVGALCVYLLIGSAFAILFSFVEIFDPKAFDYTGGEAGDPLEHMLYFSFVTLTTLGYGDMRPVNPIARTLAYSEAVIGQLYVAVLIASLVGRYVAGLRPEKGA